MTIETLQKAKEIERKISQNNYLIKTLTEDIDKIYFALANPELKSLKTFQDAENTSPYLPVTIRQINLSFDPEIYKIAYKAMNEEFIKHLKAYRIRLTNENRALQTELYDI
jgi:hypothetical protein